MPNRAAKIAREAEKERSGGGGGEEGEEEGEEEGGERGREREGGREGEDTNLPVSMEGETQTDREIVRDRL